MHLTKPRGVIVRACEYAAAVIFVLVAYAVCAALVLFVSVCAHNAVSDAGDLGAPRLLAMAVLALGISLAVPVAGIVAAIGVACRMQTGCNPRTVGVDI